MSDKIAKVMTNSLPTSTATYKIMKKRSDGRLPDREKPATKTDHKIHMTHIIDSSMYNLRHEHDHGEEMAFDYDRIRKEDPRAALHYQKQIKSVLSPVYRKMGIKLEER